MNTTKFILGTILVLLSISVLAQVNWREATPAEVTAGTLGAPVAITPRRLAGAEGGASGAVTNGQANVVLSGTFSGNAAGMTNLQAIQLTGPLITNFPQGTVVGFMQVNVKYGTTNLFMFLCYTNQ